MSVAATYEALGADVWRHWLSAPVGRTIDWLGEHVRMPGGEPFDLDLYPHIGAPGGPAEAFDDFARSLSAMAEELRPGGSGPPTPRAA